MSPISPKSPVRSGPLSSRPDHPMPTPGTVYGAHLALLMAPPRLGFLLGIGYLLLQALLLATTGILAGVQVTADGNEVTVAMPRLSHLGVDEGLGAWAWTAGALLLTGLFFTGRVWRDSRGRQRQYHWALPVDRRRHDLLRVASGAAALGVLCAVFLLTTVALALASGHAAQLGRFGPSAWASALLGPQLLYLLASALELASQGRRRRWIVAALVGWALLHVLLGALGGESFVIALTRIFWGPFGLVTAVSGPTLDTLLAGRAEVPGPWLPAFTLWTFFALVALTTAAATRPRSE